MIPELCRITSIEQENEHVFTLTVARSSSFMPGQFSMLYLFGYGEVAMSLSSDPANKNEQSHTICSVGAVTKALSKLQVGDTVGVRGPFGSFWPLDSGCKELLLVAGGLGIAALRPIIYSMLGTKKITLVYGVKTARDIVYKNELAVWQKQGVDVIVTVEEPDAAWHGRCGLVTDHLVQIPNARACICGPEVMMKECAKGLSYLDETELFFSMERNMSCAVGSCGHCLMGPYFICKDGPIFSYSRLKKWLAIKEL